MKEFIDKLIERLEESKAKFVFGIKGTSLLECMEVNAVSIIAHQLAEEYNNGYCKQQSEYKFISDKYKRETGCGYTYYDLHHAEAFKFCPYCGKKIRVAPYTEGESR